MVIVSVAVMALCFQVLHAPAAANLGMPAMSKLQFPAFHVHVLATINALVAVPLENISPARPAIL